MSDKKATQTFYSGKKVVGARFSMSFIHQISSPPSISFLPQYFHMSLHFFQIQCEMYASVSQGDGNAMSKDK